MMKSIKFVLIAFILLVNAGCISEELVEESTEKFSDQHFKTAIALIELHKVREGEYPAALENLNYLGDWDKIIFRSVEYKKLPQGYELNVTEDIFTGKVVDIEYPADFWKGLGLVNSNLKD